MSTQSAIKEHVKNHVREPKRYNVIMLNDDFTTMEFVVRVLTDIFHKTEAEAQQLMLAVHHNGRAIVGTYSFDIASTKVTAALARARAAGFPFRVMMEEA